MKLSNGKIKKEMQQDITYEVTDMKRFLMMFTVLAACSFILIACGGNESENNGDSNDAGEEDANQEDDNAADNDLEDDAGAKTAIPDDVIKDADADPIELEDQMDLGIGDTGYAVKNPGDGVLSITLNGVERTQAISEDSTLDGEEFYLIGDFTFENVSDTQIELGRPDAIKAEDKMAVENDEFNNGDLLGIGNSLGGAFVNDDNEIPEEGLVNSVYLEPGEKVDQKTSITMRGETDEYMIVFGFFDGNNRYYRNKVSFTFDSEELKEK